MAAYATPTDFWLISAPPLSLFEDGRLQRGTWTAPQRTAGSGTGTLVLTERSNPRDSYTVTVTCTRTGELTRPGYVNRVGPPAFTVSLGAGASRPLEPDLAGRIDVVDLPVPVALSRIVSQQLVPTGGGFTLAFANPAAGPPDAFGGGTGLSVAAQIGGLSIELLAQGSALGHTYDRETGRITVHLTAAAQTGAAVANYLQGTGLPLVVTGGAGAVPATALTALGFPAFAQGDAWTFATVPSPDVVAQLEVRSDHARSYLRGTYRGTDPLLTWGAALVGCVTDLARDGLIDKIEGPKDRRGSPAQAWLELVQGGQVDPTVKEEGPAQVFADLVPPWDPLAWRGGTGSFPI